MNKNTHKYPDIIADFDNMKDLTKDLQALGVTKVHTSIQQAPSSGNGHVAVCQTELATPSRNVSMPGFATPETSNTEQAHVLLSDAAVASLKNALHGITGHQNVESKSQPHEGADMPFTLPKGERTSGRPITEGQRKFIQGLAKKAGKEPDALAKDIVGIPLNNCNTIEASSIIKRLNGHDSQENDAVPW